MIAQIPKQLPQILTYLYEPQFFKENMCVFFCAM
jgi:hypothetical protein